MDELFVRDTLDYRGNLTERPVFFFNYLYSLLTQEDRFYILVLEQFLRRTPLQTVLYYFQWNIIKTFAFDLTTELQTIMKAIFVTAGKTDVERCFRSVFFNLNSLAADRYSRDIEDINQTKFQVETLSKVIAEGIKNVSEILPNEIRMYFLDMLTTIKITNGLFTQNSEHIGTFYTGINMSDEMYFDNVVQTRNIRARNEIFRLRKIFPFQDWPMSSYSLNEINVVAIQDAYANYRYFYTPFGSLDEPFVGNDLPAMDFGGMGFWIVSYYTVLQIVVDILKVVAYERNMMDSVESVKLQKDLEMKLLPRLECIYEAYSQLELPQLPGEKLNQYGINIKLKDLGDAIALEALTKIFQLSKNNRDLFPEYQLLKGFEHYSPEQLFFHSLARHCCFSTSNNVLRYQLENGPTPFHLRINGAMRLSPLFKAIKTL
ncbi:unnamed protein product [Allacma fusca]|uniref:Peptidase M13 C-terminal domain-containing protein n=1 Tax=Allacma fusca TaxID=39272 RepID=A0A8J2JIJ7_9HEXA|nr:unnamed protein product [Allacma fusca]